MYIRYAIYRALFITLIDSVCFTFIKLEHIEWSACGIANCFQAFETILSIGYITLSLFILQQTFCFNKLSVTCQWTVGSLLVTCRLTAY